MKLYVKPGFIVFILLAYAIAGGMVWPLLLAAGVHELAHLAAMTALGCRAKTLTLRFADAQIEAPPMGYAEEIVCALSGPAVNFLCCWLLRQRALGFAAVSLLLGIYNLLPVQALDGGQALRAALLLALPPEAAEGICFTVSAAACAALLTLALYAACFLDAGIWPVCLSVSVLLRFSKLCKLKERGETLRATPG